MSIFDQKDKFDPRKSIDIVNQFIAQSLEPGIENVTHLIWPEGAVTGLALEDQELLAVMGASLLSVDDTPPVWLLNALRRVERKDISTGRYVDDYYNTSAALTFNAQAAAEIAAYNDKHKLVPFGEFIPGGKWMEVRNVPVISTSLLSISASKNKYLAQFPGLPVVSPQICYEIVFSGFTPHPKGQARAEWILNQTNDAWFGDYIGPMQHANIARYRSIEEGLAIVRAASNGVSGIIDPYGRYIAKVNPKDTQTLDSQLPKPLAKTFYAKRLNYVLGLINLIFVLWSSTMGRDF